MSEPCDVCCGAGVPVSKKPCICKGTGTVIGELLGFRELVFELENEIMKLQDENDSLKMLTFMK